MSTFLNSVTSLIHDNHDLTLRQVAILGTLCEANASLGVKELHAVLRLPKPSITRATDKLIACGLVTRKRSQNDGRKVTIATTKTGAKSWQKVAVVA